MSLYYFLQAIKLHEIMLGVLGISVDDYRMGDNDGIYLLNEFNHFTPVLEPSVRTYICLYYFKSTIVLIFE